LSRVSTDVLDQARAESPLRGGIGLAWPVLVAAVAVSLLLAGIVAASQSAWTLLGAGRGVIAEEYYPVWGFVLTLATTFGQAVGWAGGTAVTYYLLTLLGVPGALAWKGAFSAVYLGLGTLPLAVYHGLFGGPMLGLPREGIDRFLLEHHPDAHWLLIGAHPFIDGSLLPLALAFLGLVWGTGDLPLRSRLVQFVLALVLFLTSLAVALSLAIHSTLVHIRL
jgi:hypothetical protein